MDREAGEKFQTVLASERTKPEPFLRLAECLIGSGDFLHAEAVLREGLESGIPGDGALWEAWFVLSAVHLRKPAGAILDAFPAGAGCGLKYRRVLEGLAHEGMFRIGGASGDPIYQTARSSPADPWLYPAGYRLPLPRGRYAIDFHFGGISEPTGRTVFDIRIEGKTILGGYETPSGGSEAAIEWKSFLITVEDGILEIDFYPRAGSPHVAALEARLVEPLEAAEGR
jgi:hypothetical protein